MTAPYPNLLARDLGHTPSQRGRASVLAAVGDGRSVHENREWTIYIEFYYSTRLNELINTDNARKR